MKLELKEMLDTLRRVHPLIHEITNYVTANDCANITLAAGASPVMADAPEEAEEMTAISQALVLNLGTLNREKLKSMLLSGEKAGETGIPVIFDPVGCGSARFRTGAAVQILHEVRPSVVRGNLSEVGSLLGMPLHTRGVDASEERCRWTARQVAETAAQQWDCIVAVTGKTDVISDGRQTLCIDNGCPAMACITGTGCMCTAVMGAFCGACPAHLLEAAAAALIFTGLCGEMAWETAGRDGLGSFHWKFMDAAGRMTGEQLEKGAKYHEA